MKPEGKFAAGLKNVAPTYFRGDAVSFWNAN